MRELLDAVEYDSATGAMTWNERPASQFANESYARRWNKRFAGKPAFSAKHAEGYRHGQFSGQHYLAHRVAWLCFHGEWPADEIDHINGDRSDNRACNLRAVTRAQNVANNAAQVGRKSKYKGVTRVKSGRWGAYFGGKWIGLFDCETAAAIARSAAEKSVYGEFARPNCGVA